jgi:hypothetical protein
MRRGRGGRRTRGGDNASQDDQHGEQALGQIRRPHDAYVADDHPAIFGPVQ